MGLWDIYDVFTFYYEIDIHYIFLQERRCKWMLDFLEISKTVKGSMTIIEADYKVERVKDIMIKGHSFYAIWDEERGFWSTDIFTAVALIDNELRKAWNEEVKGNNLCVALYLSKHKTGGMKKFLDYCENEMPDIYHDLDSEILFKNDKITKECYATKTLPYSMEEGTMTAYDELIGTLYSDEERQKFEWAIGSIIYGDSTWIQKFCCFVGDAGTGKSTVMDIIKDMFNGYCGSIDAKALGNPNNNFALEPLRLNPLIAIQSDANLSKIEDNSRLNALVSHETMVVNEKRKAQYEMKFRTFIFLGLNNEVKITDARSGMLRRILDISPTGNKVPEVRYYELKDMIRFEFGAIAYKCFNFYKKNKHLYDGYFPVKMIRATNHFYDFVEENWVELLAGNDYVDLKDSWTKYKLYCEMAAVQYPYSMQVFRNEFKNYFKDYISDGHDQDGNHIRNRFVGFRYDKIGLGKKVEAVTEEEDWLIFGEGDNNVFDILAADFDAQYASPITGGPIKSWANNTMKLKDINTHLLHWLKVPENYVMIDFDKKDPTTGEKSFELNYEAAKKFPKTYGELSKSGNGIHLIYIYNGNIDDLDNLFEEDVEIKTFKGNASMRRMLTKCCNNPIATINSGLPMKKKGEKKVVDEFVLKNEKAIRTMIEKNLRKEYHPGTKPSIDYIYDILEKAYEDSLKPDGIQYDVSDLRPRILAFANNSSNHAEYCVKRVTNMHFFSDPNVEVERWKINPSYSYDGDAPIAFFDVEVFPNLFVVVYKFPDHDCVKLINPTPEDIKDLTKYKLIGFNCRRYDNHILYARILGYTNEQLFNLSQKIISDSKNCTFHEAYNLSYTDVYDFSSAGNKQGLKKWEIQLGINHLENNLPWDQPVPVEMWEKIAEYCCNDVISTEIVFNHLKSDWIARQILSDISGLTVNDTTNQHTTRIIFGTEKHPQNEFMYRDLSKPVTWLPEGVEKFLNDRFPYMMKWWKENTDSLLPYFPGYKFENGKSYYKGIEVGEGGYVEAEPGMYGYVGLLDVASMHPHSMLAECLFGPRYTKKLDDLVSGRITIKHEDWEYINDILDGKLTPYISKVQDGEITSKDLANALKTAINSVYGLTSARFENPFRDIRNRDNIVAKRGALFMIDLAEAVKAQGWRVAHIKTDSIKIPNVEDKAIDFVEEFGRRYGYSFELEAIYDKMCLVNDAVYIARYRENDGSVGKWTATGAQFAEPYIFKTLFTHEKIEFEDYCQTKSVSTSLYLDMNEDLDEGEHNYIFVGKVGSFVPVEPGSGGGVLYREKDGKYYAAPGSKGYRWLESEVVKNNEKESEIDISYFIKMADSAVATIEEYGSFEWFVDPAPFNCLVPFGTLPVDTFAEDFMNPPEVSDDEVPWSI